MLTDAKEIEIISTARQKNVRDHNRSRAHFDNIFEDFFGDVTFAGSTLLDLGPGQYDFGVLAREKGAEVIGVDNDPAVVQLGRYKGFEVFEGRIQQLDEVEFDTLFDGLFCKFSINCFWFWNVEGGQRAFVDCLMGYARDSSWGWIAPWNGVPKNADLSDRQIRAQLAEQAEVFEEYGFRAYNLSEMQSRRYGVHGSVANNALFIKGLSVPDSLTALPV